MNAFRLLLGDDSSLTVWPVRVGQPELTGVDGTYRLANGLERPLIERFKLRREPGLAFAWLLDVAIPNDVHPVAFFRNFVDARVSAGSTPAAFAFVLPANNACVRDLFDAGAGAGVVPANCFTSRAVPDPLVASTSRIIGHFQTAIDAVTSARTLFFHVTVFNCNSSAHILATRSFVVANAAQTQSQATRPLPPSDELRAVSEKRLARRLARLGFSPLGH